MNPTFSSGIVIVGVMVAAVAGGMAADPAAAPVGVAKPFDPNHDYIIGIGDGNIVWDERTVVPGTERKVWSSYLHRFFVQHPNDLYGAEVFRSVEAGGTLGAVALPDGTVLLNQSGGLVWAHAGQPPRLEHGQNLTCIPGAMYPEGLVMHTSNPGKDDDIVTLFWVPISAGKLDYESKVRLDDVADGTHVENTPFIRHGQQIAWLDTTRTAGQLHPVAQRLQRPARVYLFDVSNRSLRSAEPNLPTRWRLFGFDGHVAFDGEHVIDPVTGKVAEPIPVGTQEDSTVLGLISGVLYVVRETGVHILVPDPAFEVLAVPLDHPERQHVVYCITKDKIRPGIKPGERLMIPWGNLFLITDDTLRAWDGSKWAKVPLK